MDKEIQETIDALMKLLDTVKDYDDLRKILDNKRGTYDNYSVAVNEFYEDDENKSVGFDLDFGYMGFTIYRGENNTHRLCNNATYYYYDEQDDYTETIDVKVNEHIGVKNGQSI